VVALIAFGLGAIIRHTAGAITSVIGLMFVVPIIIQVLPNTWRWDIMRFFPDAAGRVLSVTVGGGNDHLWSAWPQFLVTVLYAVVLVGIGAYLFRKRDA
jgi:ABC-2 type transport system permease protein